MAIVSSLILLALSSIFVHSIAAESPSLPQEVMDCRSQIERRLKNAKAGEWMESLGGDFRSKAWKRSEGKIGEWSELQTNPEESVLYQIHSRKIQKMSWRSPQCSETVTAESHFSILPKGKKTFDDKALESLVNSQKKVLVYTWSPRFVYSVTEMARLKAAARKSGYQFVAVLDPTVSKNEAESAYQKYQEQVRDTGSHHSLQLKRLSRLPDESSLESDIFRPMASIDLYMRNGLNHYPSIYVIHHGKIHPQWIVGVMNEASFLALIAEREK